jgi:hypothetical protein
MNVIRKKLLSSFNLHRSPWNSGILYKHMKIFDRFKTYRAIRSAQNPVGRSSRKPDSEASAFFPACRKEALANSIIVFKEKKILD